MPNKNSPWAQWAQEYKAEGHLLGLEVSMAEDIEKSLSNAFKKGYKKGFREGFKEGMLKGMVEALLFQLDTRFAPLPDWVSPHLAQATTHQAKVYLTRVISAVTLNELFDQGKTPHLADAPRL